MDSLTVATWCLVAVTVVYATLTGLILLQNRELVRRGTRPEVVAFIEVSQQHVAYLVVQNVGAGVARNVRIDTDKEWMYQKDIGPLGGIGFIAKGLSVLPAGGRVHSMIAAMPGFSPDRAPAFSIQITFSDANGKQYQSSFQLDIAEFLGVRAGHHSAPGSMYGV
jgi:hypothetical protein